jgi:hypothetical protein
MLICGNEDEWNADGMTDGPDPMAEIYAFIEKWEKAGKLVDSGAELESVTKSKTIRPAAGGGRVVTDGPYLELKEVVGGVMFLETADIDEAVAIASEWPMSGSTSVEIRPTVVH